MCKKTLTMNINKALHANINEALHMNINKACTGIQVQINLGLKN